MKKTKHTLLLGAVSMLLCLSMLVGSTFAWFTDTASTGVNKITAGNLDVELEYWDGSAWVTVEETTKLFSDFEKDGTTENLWEPGHTEWVKLQVRNAGSLALEYDLSVGAYGTENGGNELTYTSVEKDENGVNKTFKLSQFLVFNQMDGSTAVDSREDCWLTGDAEKAAMGKLDILGAKGVLLSGETKEIILAVYMPTWVGNEANQLASDITANGKANVFLGVNLNATQTPYEEDSFGIDYDKNADGTPDNNFSEIPINEVTLPVNPNGDTVLVTDYATINVPFDAVADPDADITVTITKIEEKGNEGIIISDDDDFVAYDVTVTNIKENNGEYITVEMDAGKNHTYNEQPGILLYHNGEALTPVNSLEELTSADKYHYNGETGIVTYTSTEFSPFTMVFDKQIIKITYKTNTDIVIGVVEYVVGEDNVLPKTNNAFNAAFPEFVERVDNAGSMVMTPDVIFTAIGKPWGDATFYYEDIDFKTPAVMPTEKGDYTVYCRLSNARLMEIELSGDNIIYDVYEGEKFDNIYENLEINASSMSLIYLGISNIGVNGYQPWNLVVDAQMQYNNGQQLTGNEEWVALPESNGWNIYLSAFLFFEGDNAFKTGDYVNVRINSIYYPVTESDGTVLYKDYVDTPSIFKCQLTYN